ncbi:MAG: DUF2202 domain-containing protein [Betaproteobacteria bacterium]|nr:DUF2202 domain-containing protein [Betaproteobacteria bacterium]
MRSSKGSIGRPNSGGAREAHRERHLAALRAGLAASAPGPLTHDERDDLLTMREEEKVARDVYLRLFDRWGLRPFENIGASEQGHMDAILVLLDHHGVPDPAQGLGVGRFRSPEMQALHDRLVQEGLQAQGTAVRTGLVIEELDIADLRAAAGRTRRPEILAVYAELERGSRNHLRAFYRWMRRLGIQYAPTHLTEREFHSIATSEHERCQ